MRRTGYCSCGEHHGQHSPKMWLSLRLDACLCLCSIICTGSCWKRVFGRPGPQEMGHLLTSKTLNRTERVKHCAVLRNPPESCQHLNKIILALVLTTPVVCGSISGALLLLFLSGLLCGLLVVLVVSSWSPGGVLLVSWAVRSLCVHWAS